jgi:type IV pilus assembly protein PilB
MASDSGRRLGEILVEAGAVKPEDVEAAAAEGRREGRLMARVLQERYGLEEPELFRALSRKFGLDYALADDLIPQVDPELSRQLPQRFCEFNRLIPIRREGDAVILATCDPLASFPELPHALGAGAVHLRLITPTDYHRLRAALDLHQLGQEAKPTEHAQAAAPVIGGTAIDSGTVALLDAIVLDAVAARASDIHLEVYGDRPRIRIRVDGDLRDLGHYQLTPAQFVAVVNVGKVRARLDIAEHRAPQGGRFSLRVRDQAFDVRAQSQPSLHGEHLVLRLLPQERKPLSISDLGFLPELAARYRRLLQSPGGLVLVVGPTGSGKSTTLYAGLLVLAGDTTRKVISVEDPIEYAIDGVQQCQTLPEIGFVFAQAMRAFVREDPDVILVGEIRDAETAMEALRASQTGHLVLSTLHCNDTVDAVQRLLDLGMHPNSIGSELLAIIAQRLAKRICTACREETTPDPELMAEIFPAGALPGFKAFIGKGCPRCAGQGTYGRVAVAEHLPITGALRQAISRQAPLHELRAVAQKAGLLTLRNQALQMVQAGLIGLRELRDMIPPDMLSGKDGLESDAAAERIASEKTPPAPKRPPARESVAAPT